MALSYTLSEPTRKRIGLGGVAAALWRAHHGTACALPPTPVPPTGNIFPVTNAAEIANAMLTVLPGDTLLMSSSITWT